MTLIHWQQQLFDAFAALGNTYTVRRDRNGSAKVSLNGAPETNMAKALDRIERALDNARASAWMRG